MSDFDWTESPNSLQSDAFGECDWCLSFGQVGLNCQERTSTVYGPTARTLILRWKKKGEKKSQKGEKRNPKQNKGTKNTTQLDHCHPMMTYLSLFQTPQGFKQVAQVTSHAIKILGTEINYVMRQLSWHNGATDVFLCITATYGVVL